MKSEINRVIFLCNEGSLFLFNDNFHNDYDTGGKNISRLT